MHLSAEYAFCVMSLQCSAFGNIALYIVFAIYAYMQIAFAICIALYVCILTSSALHHKCCITWRCLTLRKSAIHCFACNCNIHCIASVTFISETCPLSRICSGVTQP